MEPLGAAVLYTSMEIKGYRGLSSLRLDGLTRINLLVGTNNSGKTSILECIGLLHAAGDHRMGYVPWSGGN